MILIYMLYFKIYALSAEDFAFSDNHVIERLFLVVAVQDEAARPSW